MSVRLKAHRLRASVTTKFMASPRATTMPFDKALGKTCGLFQLNTDMLTAVSAIARVAHGLPSGKRLPIAYIVPIMTAVPASVTATSVVSTI